MKLSKAGSNNATGSVRVAQGTYQKALVQKLVSQLIIALVALLVVYLCFAATLVRFVPSDAGFVLTKNNTNRGGTLPANSQALVSLDPEAVVGDSMVDRLKQSFVPQKPTAVVEVLAGPIGRVKWTKSLLTVNGKALKTNFAQDPQLEYLEDQYIAVCVAGACEPGSAVLFTSPQIIGVPVQQDKAGAEAPASEK